MVQGQLVQLVGGDVEQGGHLVDESSRSARAGPVHALVGSPLEEDDLRVLPAQFDDAGDVVLEGLDHLSRRPDLLHEGNPRAFGQSQSGGPGHGGGEGGISEDGGGVPEHLDKRLPDAGIMAFVGGIQDLVPPEHCDLRGGGADVRAEGEHQKIRLYRSCRGFRAGRDRRDPGDRRGRDDGGGRRRGAGRVRMYSHFMFSPLCRCDLGSWFSVLCSSGARDVDPARKNGREVRISKRHEMTIIHRYIIPQKPEKFKDIL